MSGAAAYEISASPSGGPSIRTAVGCKASSAATRLAAEPGPWWRMPKRWTRSSIGSHHFTDRRIEIGPAVTAAHHVLEIFLQRDRILHRILHHRAHQIAGEARRIDAAAAEMRGLGPGADTNGNRLRGRERAGDGLELHLAVEGLPVPQLAKQRHDAGDLLVGGRNR